MKSFVVILGLAFSLTASATEEVSPWICPSSLEGDPDKIVSVIESKIEQDEIAYAIQIGSVCANFGSNIDVSILGPVLDLLSTRLATQVSPTENTVLQGLLRKCEDKDLDGGSLARSAAAHCQLNVLHGFFSALNTGDN